MKRVVILAGATPLTRGAGAEMLRIAARVRMTGQIAASSACFVEGGRPTLVDAFERTTGGQPAEVVIVPYQITPCSVITTRLPQQVAELQRRHPYHDIRLTAPIGAHPVVAQLVVQRATEADYIATHPLVAYGIERAYEQDMRRPAQLGYHTGVEHDRARLSSTEFWRPLYSPQQIGLMLVAPAVEQPAWEEPLHELSDQIRRRCHYAAVRAVFTHPHETTAVARTMTECADNGIRYVIVVPCTLLPDPGLHEPLPALIAAARSRHPTTTIILAGDPGCDRRLPQALDEPATQTIARMPLSVAALHV
ncbi:MAG TPA: CbiX/SirB N-terminal domain-containing protein [Roseiflexaceae bacterium]|nr:CbiX/SirB N-terminal domain-containing protein [Roseiflexaceae bacterium]